MTEVACPSCGAANPAANRFCGDCGSSLARPCPSCGAENPAGNRFCGSCGTAFADPPAAAKVDVEERKVVTVLFADLTASTEMAARLDPEDLRGVLRPFFDAMAAEIDRFGGTVEKFIGDAVVAVFGAPTAHEDDPDRAVRCALAMHRRLRDLNAEVSARAGGDLAMRIGVNTGDVITHSVGEGIVTGEAVNIAARFQALADSGSVVVGERTYRHLRASFAFAELGEVEVKGVDRPLRVWRVDAEIAAPGAAFGVVEAPFVGRGSETELLRVLFERTVRERRPNLVTIVGPPGIGKSRLSHEVARSLPEVARQGGGARVVRGRCLPYGDGLTYWPLAEILKADAGILDSDDPPTMFAKGRGRLDPRFPGEEGIGVTSVLLSSIGVEVASDPLAGTEGAAARRAIARAWQRYLESLTAEGPLLALVEDIHWADPNLLELIETVVGRAAGPALVLCTARPELFERRPEWSGGLSNATTISLSPLSAGDGATLLGHLLDGEAPAEVVGPILHRSEGNPFFAGELLRMMIEDGTLARRDGRWRLTRDLPSALPDTVQSVIASRIDLLPAVEKRAIQDASFVGRVFWVGAVQQLQRGVDPGDLDAAVDALVAKGLAREQPASTIAGERELIFNHILTRDVAYASIPRARRAQTHAAVGRWVEDVTRGRDEEFSEILAHHFELAGDAERTARYAMLAGNRQLRVFAAETAIDWYDRALDAVSKQDVATRARIALMRGLALEQIGRYPEALTTYEESTAWAAEAGDDELEARALAAKPHVAWLLDRYDEGQALLPLALERARRTGLADVEARLLYTAGTISFSRGEYADALPLHRRALEVATRSGDLEGQALAHHGLCETLFFRGPFEEGLDHGVRADAIFSDLGQRLMVAHNGYMVAWSMAFLGRMDEAQSLVEASVATSHEIGNRRDEGFALYDRGWFSLEYGRIDAAKADIDRGLQNFRELGLRRGELGGLTFGLEILGEVGDMDGLLHGADAAIAVSDDLGGWFIRPPCLALRGWAALATGDVDGSARWFEEAHRHDGDLLNAAWTSRAEVMAGEWTGSVGLLETAGAKLERDLLPQAPLWGAWGPYARALAALLEGRSEDAAERAGVAMRFISPGHDRLRWRVHRVAWKAGSARGQDREAEEHRAAATALLRREAEATSGPLRERFLARPDVAELLR